MLISSLYYWLTEAMHVYKLISCKLIWSMAEVMPVGVLTGDEAFKNEIKKRCMTSRTFKAYNIIHS